MFYFFIAQDGKEMGYRLWQADNEKKVLQLIPGACEHIERYDEFASWLSERGVSVYGMDNRGHGINRDLEGFVHIEADKWHSIIDDARQLGDIIREKTGKKPYLLGHSMGSFIARSLALEGGDYKMFIFTGTAWQPKAKLYSAKALVRALIGIYGELRCDPLVDRLSFGEYRRIMAKKGYAQGLHGWLTSDESKQEENLKNELLSEAFSLGAFLSLFRLVEASQDGSKLDEIKAPIYILSGDRDAAGDFGLGPRRAYEFFKKSPVPVYLQLYKDMHHEILNERERLEVYRDILYYILR